MKLEQAMIKAIKYFEKRAQKNNAEIRNVYALEMSTGINESSALFKIEYAINGDYTESDKKPYCIRVVQKGKNIEITD